MDIGTEDGPLTALQRAVELCGTQAELSRRIQLDQRYLWNWLNRDLKASPEYCRAIEDATNGRVTRYQLRPDVFGAGPKRTRGVK